MIEKKNLELIEELKNKVFEDKEILSVERLGGLTNFTPSLRVSTINL